jgi:hypothetical protein
MRGTNSVVINYEDINSKIGIVQASGLIVTGPVQVSGPATRLRGRRQLTIQNLGADPVFIGGDSSVSATGVAGGLSIPSGDMFTLDVLDVGDVWIISGGTSDVRILELK